jgi:hypothetical protein
MDDPETRSKAEVDADSETLLASPHPDPPSAMDKPAETSPYVYKPLATPDTIRIFRLYPGTGDEPLRGELVYTELIESAVVNDNDRQRLKPKLVLDKYRYKSPGEFEEVEDLPSLLQQHDCRATLANPEETFSAFRDRNAVSERRLFNWKPRLWIPYEALSYVWGEPLFSRKLYTPSGFIPITSSLADALHHLRHPQMKRNLWIDAICINQDDVHERGHQVSGMARVYASAEGVLVWLGPDASKIAEGSFSQIKAYAETPITITNNLIRFRRMTPLARHVFELSWFSRLWVVQELVLSHKALFCWGNAQIDHQNLSKAVNYSGEGTWLRYINNYKRRVPELLRYTKHLSCSDPRDRIYGLLGLCDESDPLSEAVAELLPDYSRTVEEVFTDVACLFIDHASSRELLTQVDASFGNDAGLPSWVPDWRLPETSLVFEYLQHATSRSDARHSVQSLLTVADRSTRILSMYGIKLDSLSEPLLYSFDAADMQTMLSAMTVVWIKLISIVPHQSLAIRELALLRLLDEIARRDVLSQCKRYLEGRNVPELSGPRKFSHAVGAMMRSMLQVTNKVFSKDLGYFGNQPNITTQERKGRKLFLTLSGLLGIGPMRMEVGDELILLCEQRMPFLGIMRRDHEHYRFIGTAFVPTICESGLEDSYRDDWFNDRKYDDTYMNRLRALWNARAQDVKRFDFR